MSAKSRNPIVQLLLGAVALLTLATVTRAQEKPLDGSGLVIGGKQANPRAPALAPIGNQSVELGQSLQFRLTATNLTANPVVFSASPLPLPENASLDATSGFFQFTPVDTQVGDIELTFIASNGHLTDSEAITITVVGAAPGGVTSLVGQLVDTNQFVEGNSVPIKGATVSLLGIPGAVAESDAHGVFMIDPAAAGDQLLDIDTSTAEPGPGGVTYAGFRETIHLFEGVQNVLHDPIFLPQIDQSSVTTVDPNEETVVENKNIDVTLVVPPHTAKFLGEDFDGELSISEVPEGLAPAPLPEALQPGLLITIQPVGVTFDTPVPITFPNTDGLPAGSLVDIWSLDPQLGIFVVVGKGQVSTDETEIVTIQGGILAADWHAVLPPAVTDPANSLDPDHTNPSFQSCASMGSQAAVASGNLSEVHPLVTYQSIGRARGLRLVYNSTAADPQPVIGVTSTILEVSAVPTTVSAKLSVASIDQGFEIYTDTSSLNENANENFRQVVQFDGSMLTTGRYPYELTLTSNFSATSISGVSAGHAVVNNQRESPFGAGWTLGDLTHLTLDENGNALITQGDGSTLFFELAETVSGAIASWPFDDGANPTADVVGGHDGDLLNGAGFTTENIAPIQGNISSLELDGANDFMEVLDSDDFNFLTGQPMSASLWLRQTQFKNVYHVLGKRVGCSGSTGFWQSARDNSGCGIFFNTTCLLEDLPVGEWVHIAYTYDGETARVYWNGVERNAGPASFPSPNGASLRVGTSGSCPSSQFFAGVVDGLAFYNRELTADEVASLASGDTVLPDENGLVMQVFGDVGGVAATYAAVSNGFAGLQPSPFTVTTSDGPQAVEGTLMPVVDFPVTPFDSEGFYNVGPDGSVADGSTFFAPKGDDVSVQPPTDIFGVRLSGQLFLPNGGDVTFTVGVDDVFDLVINGQSVISKFTGGPYNETTGVALGLPQGFVPITLNYADGASDANLVLMASGGGLPGGVIPPGFLFPEVSESVQQYRAPAGEFSVLSKAGDDGFIRTFRDGVTIHYDESGLQTSIVDRNGTITTYEYDGANRLVKVTDPVGLSTILHYNDGLLSSVTDPVGRVTLIVHNDAGDLVAIADPDGSRREFSYDNRHRLISQLSKAGFETFYSYGFHGRNIGSALPDGSTLGLQPSELVGLSDLSSGVGSTENPADVVRPEDVVGVFTDGNGNSTSFGTNSLGEATVITDAAGGVTEVSYDGDGNVVSMSGPGESAVELSYDSTGNLISVSQPTIGATTSYEYGPEGCILPMSVQGPGDVIVEIAFDGRCNPIAVKDGEGETSSASYSPEGLIELVIDPMGGAWSYTYDAVGMLAAVQDPLGNQTSWDRDLAGNVTAVTDPTGFTTTFAYDSMNRVLSATDARGGVTQFQYDNAGNLVATTDAEGNGRYFEYDSADRLLRVADALGNFSELSYDGNGNVVERLTPNGSVITYSYDALDRLIEKAGDGVNLALYAYDPGGNVTSAENETCRIENAYDTGERLVSSSVTYGLEGVTYDLSYEYDSRGNRIAVIDDDGKRVEYSYDKRDSVVTIVDGLAGDITIEYDALGRRERIGRWNGLDTAYSFDSASRVEAIVHSSAAGVAASYAYGYDQSGNRTLVNQVRPDLGASPTISYGYDELHRLVSATSQIPGESSESFGYDGVGNRITVGGATFSAVFDEANRLLEDEDFCYSYDSNGNLIERRTKGAGGCSDAVEIRQYTYDSENQLREVLVDGVPIRTFDYDALGRRSRVAEEGDVSLLAYDREDVYAVLDASGASRRRYTHGPGIDEPLSVETDLGTHFLLVDVQGSVGDVVDAAGVLVSSVAYSAFGMSVLQSGTPVATDYGFVGREGDSESGLYYMRGRYYDVASARFTSPDPIGLVGGDSNLYRFAKNNPVSWIDPIGLLVVKCEETKLIMGAAVADLRRTSALFGGVLLTQGLFAGAFGVALAPVLLFADNGGATGPYDFKWVSKRRVDAGGDELKFEICLGNGKRRVITAADFGNYLAGYAFASVFGPQIGGGAAKYGGVFFAWAENLVEDSTYIEIGINAASK